MSTNNPSVPDLASVLQTLAGLAQSQQPFPPSNQSLSNEGVQQPWATTYPMTYPHPPPVSQQTPVKQPTKVIDPATIIDWPAGLRCVMKTVAKHDKLLFDIRKMIKVQHEHEAQWFQGRKELVVRQQSREEGQKKMDEVMRAVGGKIASDAVDNSPQALQKELEDFDLKVYKAQVQMVTEMSARLRNYGIPFFGTKNELVRTAAKRDSNGRKYRTNMIDEADLVEMQRKMLALLEDMCNE